MPSDSTTPIDLSGLPPMTVVGAGLGGSLLALMLAKAGVNVTLYERRPDPRTTPPVGGRSINLALSHRGRRALARVGLEEKVLENAIAMPGRLIHEGPGEPIFQAYGTEPTHAIYSVSRADLNRTLIEELGNCANVTTHFEHKCVDIDLSTLELTFEADDGTKKDNAAQVVLGADGAFSAIRGSMQKQDRFDFQQQYLTHGYKELTIPPSDAGAFRLDPNGLHIWPRHQFMMIALPNADKSFTCTCFWPLEGPVCFDRLQTEKEIIDFFQEQFPDAVPHLVNLVEEYQTNPVGTLVTMRCYPYHVDGKVVLLGDAAHAVVPFFGQGMNASFEDCSVLMDCLAEQGQDLNAAFSLYTARRHENVNALADMAIEHYIEMRDSVTSQSFLWKKWLDQTLTKNFPQFYKPLYELVTFSHVPYAQARRRAQRQDAWVRRGLLGLLAIFIAVGVSLVAWLTRG